MAPETWECFSNLPHGPRQKMEQASRNVHVHGSDDATPYCHQAGPQQPQRAPPCQHTISIFARRGGSLGPRDLGMLCKAAIWTQVYHKTGQQPSQCPWNQCHPVLPPSRSTATTERRPPCQHTLSILARRGGSLGPRGLGMLCIAVLWTK